MQLFCRAARTLLDTDRPEDFVKFVLNGYDGDDPVFVNPLLNRVRPDERLRALRDYDSLLGIDRNINIEVPLTIFTLARKDDTLSKNIHLSYTFSGPTVSVLIPFFFVFT